GNGVQGSAANAAYALGQRGYKIVLPPSGRPVNAPTSDYFRTTVLYDATQKRSHTAAQQLANLFGDADVKPLLPSQAALQSLANDPRQALRLLFLRPAPPHGRAEGEWRDVLGDQHDPRHALERDDDRDRERSRAGRPVTSARWRTRGRSGFSAPAGSVSSPVA